ncbi:MAG: ABC transporter substrate-binding protein [Candidatus Lambdaproteobacteria bacterium]|nr:ABC transporter substrate-binding protein [Candidatus Lambdaproteobacteria bacterium]
MTSYTRWLIAGAAVLAALTGAAPAWAQKYGGVIRFTLQSNPPDLSIHETAVTESPFALGPVYNSVVAFDLFKTPESLETIVPELAESWAWDASGTALTFRLRPGIRWHDGKPFTGRDVKYTFDAIRGATQIGLKLNPRKLWYVNVAEITAAGDHEVTFRVKRPQPSLLAILAAGLSPVYPAHRTGGEIRTGAMGTGPFKLKQFVPDQRIELVKNPDYFVKGRPYLDGALFFVLKSQAAQIGALIGKQVDLATTMATPKSVYEQLKAANAGLAFQETVTAATYNLIVNTRRPPFDNLRLRQAVNLAMDRNALLRSLQGGGIPGSAMIPQPYGVWGLTPEQLADLPGYGDPAKNKAEARRILAEEGYTAEKPLKVKVTVRTFPTHVPWAAWAAGELKSVGIDAELRQIDTGAWYGALARRDFDLGFNATSVAIDDPDAAFYENYACGSQRNYSDYCNVELMKKVDAQSIETDHAKRLRVVNEIDIQLQREVARPYLAYRTDYYPHYPYVKNWNPHPSIYNGWRLTEVWLDR